MDECSQIQQESDLSEVPVVTPHTSLGHSDRDDWKTKKSQGPLEGKSSKNKKDGCRGKVRVQPKTTFPLPRRENIPKRARRETRKEGTLLLPHQLPVQHQTVIHLTMNQRSKNSRRYLRTNGTNIKYRNQWLPLQMNISNCTSQTRSYTPAY